MINKVDVSIIIVNYNTKQLILDCIESIYTKTKGITFEIIVVDNASQDGSVDAIKESYPEVVVIASKQNLGFGVANNRGTDISRGKAVFFLNSDTLLVNNAVKELYDTLYSETDIALCGANLFGDERCIETGSSYSHTEDSLIRHICTILYLPLKSKPKIYNRPTEVRWVSGASMMFDKKTFIEIGSFDPLFFMYFEEADTALRLKQRKKKIIYVPSAKIIHLEGMSSNKNEFDKPTKFIYLTSQLHFMKKYNRFGYLILFILHLIKSITAFTAYTILNNKQRIGYWKKYLKTILKV